MGKTAARINSMNVCQPVLDMHGKTSYFDVEQDLLWKCEKHLGLILDKLENTDLNKR